MNILIISPFFSPNIGGVETHLDDLCSFLSSCGHRVDVVTYQPLTFPARGLGKEVKGNIVVHRYNWFYWKILRTSERFHSLEFALLFPGLFFATLLFMMRNSKKIDLIHSQGYIAGSIANFMSLIFNKPYIVSIHWIIGRGRLRTKALLNGLLSRARIILTLSRAAMDGVIDMGIPRDRVRCFKYWVDLSSFRPVDKKLCKRAIGLEGKTLVLYVGRLIREKGVMIILNVAKMFETRSEVVFCIIGAGPLESEVGRYSEAHSNLIFFGAIANERLSLYYNSADLLMVPSIGEEGFGRVIIEALSCGTPVLASNKGAIPEALDDTVGVVCNPDPLSIASKLDSLLNIPGSLESLAKRCRTYSVRNFGIENARTIERAYYQAY